METRRWVWSGFTASPLNESKHWLLLFIDGLLVCHCLTVPTAPPRNVAIQSATATQLDVTWEPPPVDAQNGDIQGYKVNLKQQKQEQCLLWCIDLNIDVFSGDFGRFDDN